MGSIMLIRYTQCLSGKLTEAIVKSATCFKDNDCLLGPHKVTLHEVTTMSRGALFEPCIEGIIGDYVAVLMMHAASPGKYFIGIMHNPEGGMLFIDKHTDSDNNKEEINPYLRMGCDPTNK